MPVGERDAPDLTAGLPRGRDQLVGATPNGGVDQREAVVLAHQERVDESPASDLDQVRIDLRRAHAASAGQKVGSITVSPRRCGPKTTNSRPSGPASKARVELGARRIASRARTSLISSSILIRP